MISTPAARADTLDASAADVARTDDTIFVSIASYRDRELLPTIEDCLAKARRPENLRFGICWQHGSEEAVPDRFAGPTFRVVDVDWRRSEGACWARAQIMKLWNDEKWYLQLDSHHRFVRDWDVRVLRQASATGSHKPVLTTYAGPFAPDDPGPYTPEPMRMEFDRFTNDGLVLFRPGPIREIQTTAAPIRSRFLSAHFLFAPGQFVRDVPYDPSLYFIGEEITMAVRAFTHGYDLFHPGEVIVWHEYTRTYRPKHWDDHTAERGAEVDWSQRDASSREIARRLLTEGRTGPFGCGLERSVADYEAFAGISFAHRRAQDYTRHHFVPPNPSCDDSWIRETRDHTVQIEIAANLVAPAMWASQFWSVSIRDDEGGELLRADADRMEIDRLRATGEDPVKVTRCFESTARPGGWTVHPCAGPEVWLDPIKGLLASTGEGEWVGVAKGVVELDVGTTLSITGADRELLALRPHVVPGFGWKETSDGILVTRNGRPSQFAVNRTGALVLELANGRYSVGEIIDVIGDSFGLVDPPRAEVTGFVNAAWRSGLIQLPRLREGDGDG